MNNNPHLVEKSGVLIEEKAAEKSNIQSLAVAFDQTEVQDLHGYAKPWIGGEGKNLFDKDNATEYARAINGVTGKWVSYEASSYAFACEGDTDYVVSTFHENLDLVKVAYITDPLPQSASDQVDVYALTQLESQGSVLIHTGENATYIIIQIRRAYAADTLVQIEKLATNLFDTSTATQKWVYPTNEITNRADASTEEFAVTAGQRVCLCGDVVASTNNVYMIAFLDSSNAVLSRSVATSGYSLFVDAPTGAVTCIAGFSDYTAAGITTPVLSKFTPSYEPYENYCPITNGITGLTVCHTGKNIFDKDHAEYVTKKYIDDTGTVQSMNTYQYIANYILVKPNTTYAVQINKGTSTAGFTVPMYDANKEFIEREVAIGAGTVSGIAYGTFTTTAETKYIRFSCPVSSNVRPTIMIEEGSQSSEYEPFGEQYPVSWETEAGIAFKGTLNLTTGVLHVDNLVWTFDGTEGWTMQWGTSTANGVFRINSPAMLPNPANNFISNFDVYKNVVSTNTNRGIYFNRGSTYLNIRNSRCAYLNGRTQSQVVTEWKAFLAQRYANGQPLEIMCRGVDKSYQLTPQQVKLLAGTNNIWADTGEINIAYWAH